MTNGTAARQNRVTSAAKDLCISKFVRVTQIATTNSNYHQGDKKKKKKMDLRWQVKIKFGTLS